ncbi:MAG: hypothetical protein N6V41_01130, partial [Candidatus Portiera aleyrodidarum]|nr:hypothetical protein [Candidatus Portiera aleyrodidarum]
MLEISLLSHGVSLVVVNLQQQQQQQQQQLFASASKIPRQSMIVARFLCECHPSVALVVVFLRL